HRWVDDMTKVILKKRTLVLIASLGLVLSLTVVWLVKLRADRSLAQERTRLAKQNFVPFEHKNYSAINNPAISVWQSYKNIRAIERFNDAIFVATDGGLVQFGPTGNLLRHYSVLDGLPDSDLLSLAAFNSKLFIGTRTSGLVAFDGTNFEGYRWTDRAPQSIDALLSDAGRLLVGTRAGGLIAFDGSQFTEIKTGAEQQRLNAINFLLKNGATLFVGTFNDGLWTEQGSRWSHFTTVDGLHSNRIVGLAVDNDNLFVASDYGLATANLTNLATNATNTGESGQPRFLSVAVVPSLSSLVQHDGMLVLCKDNGETFGLRIDSDLSHLRRTIPTTWNSVSVASGSKLATLDRDLWLLGNDGIHRAVADNSDGGNIRFSRWGEFRQSLASNLISALSVDSQGRLWAGTFRNGIDVLGPSGTLTAHLESESVREINSLIEDAASKRMLAASSAGAVSFDTNLRATEHLSAADGLLSNSVMQVAHLSDNKPTLAFATSKGLSFGVQGKFRGVTTVQGLPSNSLYAVLSWGGRLYVGTLGGLAVLED